MLNSHLQIKIIVAIDPTGIFGDSSTGKIPWRDESFTKDDFIHFQKVTKDSICIMGYNTYAEILEIKQSKIKPSKGKKKRLVTPLLKDRISYVISSRKTEMDNTDEASFFPSLRSAIESIPEEMSNKSIFVIGGERLFIEALNWVQELHITVVPNLYKGDKKFPLNVVLDNFTLIEGEQQGELRFLTFRRNDCV